MQQTLPVGQGDAASDYFAAVNQLTPVQKEGPFFFKRDDLFRPFGTPTLNGGKLRQILTVLRDCHVPGVITAASIHSPQIPLVAGTAQYLGLKSIAVVGGSKITPELSIANDFGAQIRRAHSGRHRALFAEVSRLNAKLGYHIIPYGIAPPSQQREFFLTQSEQVSNLPDKLDALIVTCGSGISAIAILLGLWRFSKRVGELILVATGPPRLQKILRTLEALCPEALVLLKSTKLNYIDLFNTPGFQYERKIPFTFCNIKLHPRYEAKTFHHVLHTGNCDGRRTLFWIIGGDLSEQEEARRK